MTVIRIKDTFNELKLNNLQISHCLIIFFWFFMTDIYSIRIYIFMKDLLKKIYTIKFQRYNAYSLIFRIVILNLLFLKHFSHKRVISDSIINSINTGLWLRMAKRDFLIPPALLNFHNSSISWEHHLSHISYAK
jgi:hypothetical protein